MSHEMVWQPACSNELLLRRARMNAVIRQFFGARAVLEVETPSLSRAVGTDPALSPFVTSFSWPGQTVGCDLYLQTSPEFAMKRLLAAGSGDIFQICKAFRNEESGRHHNPEFSLLEWYRIGFSLFDLIAEIEALVAELFGQTLMAPERYAYCDIFSRYIELDPLTASIDEFDARARVLGLVEAAALCGDDRTVWLDVLFSHFVQPHLGCNRLTAIYHYPAFMPSLARVCAHDGRLVERVEVFMAGMELGNGFHELADAVEQSARFNADCDRRKALNLPVYPQDDRLLSALQNGLPDCSGIAIGLDRLLMVWCQAESINSVLAFPLARC
ncbi:MAG: EF-P lysine aminoacylase EpmA [Methylococcaceae bacterium]